MNVGLPREVLKWLQTLDLSFTYHNPKEDFCNGHLIAEILSNYYPRKISPDLVPNVSSVQQKINNWAYLKSFIRKHKLSIPLELCDSVMHKEPYRASELLVLLYTLFSSNKKLSWNPNTDLNPNFLTLYPSSVHVSIPHFAFPTTSALIHATPFIAETTCKDQVISRKRSEDVQKWYSDYKKQKKTASITKRITNKNIFT